MTCGHQHKSKWMTTRLLLMDVKMSSWLPWQLKRWYCIKVEFGCWQLLVDSPQTAVGFSLLSLHSFIYMAQTQDDSVFAVTGQLFYVWLAGQNIYLKSLGPSEAQTLTNTAASWKQHCATALFIHHINQNPFQKLNESITSLPTAHFRYLGSVNGR